MSESPTILVVEDDQAIQGIVEDALSEGGFEVAVEARPLGGDHSTLPLFNRRELAHWNPNPYEDVRRHVSLRSA